MENSSVIQTHGGLARPGPIDVALATGTILMLAAMSAALYGGRSQLDTLSLSVWLHIATLGVALALSPLILLRRKGDTLHRMAGYVWLAAMIVTAGVSFDIRFRNAGELSAIHLLSVVTLLSCAGIWLTARYRAYRAHRWTVYSLITGALLIAGVLTFQFDRLFDRWLAAALGW